MPATMEARGLRAKVCLVGEAAVGKTKLIRRFVLDLYDETYLQTLGTRVYEKEVKVVLQGAAGPVPVGLAIWDIMGQKGFRELLKDAYLYRAHGILAVCDATRRETLADLDGWIAGVRAITGPVPILVAANKSDLKGRLEIGDADLARAAGAYDAPFLWTSAKTGENVEHAFHILAERILTAQSNRAEPTE